MQLSGQTLTSYEDNKIYALRYDTIFKNVFHNKKCLKQFFKEVFKESLEGFWYVDKEQSKENKNLRYRVSDLVIETEKRIIIIELQNKNLENIETRSKMYVSGFYVRQNPGEFYEKVKPVELYLILNYPYQTPAVLKEYEEMNKKYEEQFGNLSKIKIWNIYEALKIKKEINYDYARLFNLDNIKKPSYVLIELKKRGFENFIKHIEYYNLDYGTYKKLKEEETMEMSFEQATSMIKYNAEQRGEQRGIITGKLETAVSMLKEGLEMSLIKKITGLSEKQIEKYANSK